jgi:hypothetical protein
MLLAASKIRLSISYLLFILIQHCIFIVTPCVEIEGERGPVTAVASSADNSHQSISDGSAHYGTVSHAD